MKPAQLLTHFDRISDAPDAIPRLRRLILGLAVRGKLVEQDPRDEPASKLVKRIQAEGAKLRTESKIKKFEAPTPCDAEAIPFQIPISWTSLPLKEIGVLSGGMTPSMNRHEFWGGSINWFSPKDIKSDELVGSELKVTSAGVEETGLQLYPPGCLFMVARSGILKRTFPVSINCVEATANQDLKVLRPFVRGIERYLQIMFRGMIDVILSTLVKTGTTVQSLKYEEFESQPFPLPPLAEQHRIVVKVDELMALCDRLEAMHAERESRRDRLVASSLNRLNNGADPEAFRDHARFYFNHLPRLTTKPEHIQQLRQTILNLAVRGKLAPQDPNDEPASELLAKNIKLPNGYQRRRKILKKISMDSPEEFFPFIPSSWQYTDIQTLYDLNAIIDYADGNHGSLYPRSSEFGDSGVTFATAKDLANGRVMWESCAKLNEERASQLTKGWAQGGDVLLTHNATVGRIARVESQVGRFLLGTSVTFYRLNSNVLDPGFFFYVLKSPLWQRQLEAIMAQTTRNQVSIQKQAFFRVIVPPLAEQQRIVDKVEELMALCDRLEAQLTTTHTDSRRLLEAVLHEALAPAV